MVAWVIAVAVCAGSALTLVNSLGSTGWDVPGSATVTVREALSEGFPSRGETPAVLVVHDRDNTVGDLAFEQRTREVFDYVSAYPTLHVQGSFGWSTLSPSSRGQFVGKDQRTAVTSIGLGIDNDTATSELPGVQDDIAARFESQGIDASLVNVPSLLGELNSDITVSLIRAEAIALPLVAVVLLLLFGSVVSVMAAMATTVTGLVFTLGILGPIAANIELSIFVENIVVMLGMGVGVDYALILIKRFKEELAAGYDVDESVARMLATAGRTVIASGVTIAVAGAALFVVPLNAILSLAAGAVLVVATTVLVSVFLMPVLLHVLGTKIDAGRVWLPASIRHEESVADERLRWYRVAMQVMRRPWLFLVVASAVLMLASIPAFGMKLSNPDDRIVPQSPVRTGFQLVNEQFAPGVALPIQVVIDTDRPLPDALTDGELTRFVDQLQGLPDVQSVTSALTALRFVAPTAPLDNLAPEKFDALPADAQAAVRYFVSADNRRFVVEVRPTKQYSDPAVSTLLDSVRTAASTLPPPLHASVGGAAQRSADINSAIASRMPLAVLLMIVAVYVVLLLAFRSILLPLKAIAMNGLSVTATFGVLVMIFQNGWLPVQFGLDHTGYLISFVPPLVLALVVGLSTDYEVFLLSRVREHYLASGDNTKAVALGLARTAPLISGAAFLMIVVFAAFGLAGNVIMQQMGIGLAVAVLVDATLVRFILVPAAMRLLGPWNWWLPGRVTVHARRGVE